MNFSLKPHPLIAHWVPGGLVVVAVLMAWNDWSVSTVLALFAGDASKATISIIVLSVAAFVIGEIFDSLRDGRESDDVNWDFFYDASEDEIKRLNESYFTYYVLDKNLVCAISVAWVFFAWHPPAWACWNTLSCHPSCCTGLCFLAVTAIVGITIWILVRDSKLIRDEIKRHTNKRPRSSVPT